MPRRFAVLPLAVIVLTAPARGGDWLNPLARMVSPKFRDLDDRRADLAAAQEEAPIPPGSPSTLGYHSRVAGAADRARWVEIDLGREHPVDSVVLFPATSPPFHPNPGFYFPARFKVELSARGDWSDTAGVADYTDVPPPFPTNLPVVLPAGGRPARKVRLTATRLTELDGWHCMAMGELAVLSGRINVAAGRPVAAVDGCETAGAWSDRFLVDGQSAFGPPLGPARSESIGYSSRSHRTEGESVWVQVDLGERRPIDELRLVPARPPELPGRGGVGFPQRFRVELADDPGFTNPAVLLDATRTPFLNPGDGLVVIPGTGAASRYVRITVTQLWRRDRDDYVFALAELQAYSGGANVARGATVTASDADDKPGWSPAGLTDGFASGYELLEWTEWAAQAAARSERVIESRGLADRWGAARDAAVEGVVRAAAGTCAAAAVLTVGLVWRARRARRREVERVRRQIARDLHDEVGSNLGSIVLLGRSAWRDDPAAVREDLREVTRIAKETTETLRNLVWLLDPPDGKPADLLGQMRRVAESLAGGAAVRFELPPEACPVLPLETQRQLMLGFKEALHNAAKHAGATEVTIRCHRAGGRFAVEVADNGAGFDPARPAAGTGLRSLRARAEAVGGTLTVESARGRGTIVRLTVPCRG